MFFRFKGDCEMRRLSFRKVVSECFGTLEVFHKLSASDWQAKVFEVCFEKVKNGVVLTFGEFWIISQVVVRYSST